jgi:hypothetical protein
MIFDEFMYRKMPCAYMTSCATAECEVLSGKMCHGRQRCGHRPVKMSFLHEAMHLVGM